ncbi:MAG TPA: winged helix-turn-helix transcriptional regulator [Vicinamibacterales bacterium]|nr:winged helix-turn-helix transcriptional regulator [Vicinamibacterales bacterium]
MVSSQELRYHVCMGLQPALCVRFHHAVELIGRRWTGAVIQLLLGGRKRYAELRGAIPDISDRMLSERLRELELEGIVARIVVPETPVRVEYELTAKGRALERALGEIGRWAERWISPPPVAAPRESTTKDLRSAKSPRRAAAASPRAHR